MMLTNEQLVEREAAYAKAEPGLEEWDEFIDVAIQQEPALLARLREGDMLLDEAVEHMSESISTIMAYIERVNAALPQKGSK